MRSYLAILLLLISSVALPARSNQETCFPVHRHEVYVGWGDMMYETAVYHNTQNNSGYRYLGHIFGGYQYSFNHWFGLGVEADYNRVKWNGDQEFHNITILPNARFTYFRRGIVTMYSGIGAGLLVNSGTEMDYLGRKTITAPALELTLYGISVSVKDWFASFELGGLNSLNGKNEVFMAGSRLFSFSMGYRF